MVPLGATNQPSSIQAPVSGSSVSSKSSVSILRSENVISRNAMPVLF